MKTDDVKRLQRIEVELAELIIATRPQGKAEWDAFDKMVAGHKQLRGIDTDSLLQLELSLQEKLPTTPKFRKDCPRCAASGLYRDPTDTSHEPRQCNCNLVEDNAWESVKKEWEQQLASVEA